MTRGWRLTAAGAALTLLACGDRAAESPTPPRYRWPSRVAWRVDYVAEPQHERRPVLRYTERKTLRLLARDDEYLLFPDSVIKASQRPGEPTLLVPLAPQDTLTAYVQFDGRGQVRSVQLACDPAEAVCGRALPSAVRLELRRLVPSLPALPVPRGSSWTDTLRFDDGARSGGARGTVVTTYTAGRDTTIGDAAHWIIGWRSVRRAFRVGPEGGIAEEPPVQEEGVTFVEKLRHLPVFAAWAGAAVAPPDLRALGATATGYRGRAYLVPGVFDSAITRGGGP